MCNLYRLDKGQDHLRRFFKAGRDDSGNQPPLPGIYPPRSPPCSVGAADVAVNDGGFHACGGGVLRAVVGFGSLRQ
jgi:hypothetical protein